MAKEDIIKYEWKPGESGNPKGRPIGSLNRSTIARKWLQTKSKIFNPITNQEETLTQEDIATLALIKKVRSGDVHAYKALMDSSYGQPKETIDLNQIAEQPLFLDVPENDSDTEDSKAKEKK